mgnify:CR=1 FL=1
MSRYGRKDFFGSIWDSFGWVAGLLLATFVAAMAAGWVMNVKAVWYATALDGETIVRIIAIFVWPIGCIIGWL